MVALYLSGLIMNAMNHIKYVIRPANPEAHLFEIRLTIEQPATEGQVLSIPAWIPGSYMIRDFAKNVVQLSAHCAESAITVTKLNKQSWRCAPCDGPLEIIYTVYAWDLSVRSAHFDTTHGYFNGTSLFLKVHGQENKPCSVELLPPSSEAYRDWSVATTLPRAGAKLYGFGLYQAADYDELIDHPVEMANFTLIEFEASGIPHAMAITGRHHADRERLARDLKRICEYQIELFGELPPMERYLFLTMVVGDGYGGLEHRSSSSLLCNRGDLPLEGEAKVSDDYRNFLGLCSHEYFHTWNIKRIKPSAFLPYDLSCETHTSLLWAFEGITSYYDDLTLVRAGLISDESYLELLGQTITRVLRGTGRLKQTVAESSFDAWTKFYKQDENAPNAIVSYYAKGSLVALALDLTIRSKTDGAKSLDDVMRALWQHHGKPLLGVTEQGIEQLVTEVSGIELDDFFELALRSTDDLPLEALLATVGINFNLRPAESSSDKGGKAPTEKGDSEHTLPALGIRTAKDNLGVKLLNVFENGAAQKAGLSAGDVVIAVGGLQAKGDSLDNMIKPYHPGERVTLHAFRRDELLEFEVTPLSPPNDTCHLVMAETADDATRARRDAWLKGV